MQAINQNVPGLFTEATHHLNRAVISTLQNVFYQKFREAIDFNEYAISSGVATRARCHTD